MTHTLSADRDLDRLSQARSRSAWSQLASVLLLATGGIVAVAPLGLSDRNAVFIAALLFFASWTAAITPAAKYADLAGEAAHRLLILHRYASPDHACRTASAAVTIEVDSEAFNERLAQKITEMTAVPQPEPAQDSEPMPSA